MHINRHAGPLQHQAQTTKQTLPIQGNRHRLNRRKLPDHIQRGARVAVERPDVVAIAQRLRLGRLFGLVDLGNQALRMIRNLLGQYREPVHGTLLQVRHHPRFRVLGKPVRQREDGAQRTALSWAFPW